MATETAYRTGGIPVPWWAVVLEGLIAVIIGLFLLSSPGITTTVLITVLGIFWLFGGIFSLASLLVDRQDWGWKVLTGVIGILAGLAIIAYPYYSAAFILTFFIIMIGIWAIIYGAAKLAWGFRGGGAGMAILGALIIVLGILLLLNPLAGALVLPWIFGVFAVFGGIVAIITGIMMR